MKRLIRVGHGMVATVWLSLFTLGIASGYGQAPAANPSTNQIRIVEAQGAVEVLPSGSTVWTSGRLNQTLKPLDRLRTGANSRVALRWSDQTVIPFDAGTELEILPAEPGDSETGMRLFRGVLSFFHRDRPGRIRIVTRGATAGVEGTEFILAVNDQDRTVLSVVDGRVRFGNDQATLVLTNGQQAIADLGQAPSQTAGFIANNLLQWCFYYPAVLDPDELPLTPEEQNALAGSLAAYRSGDLLAALAQYPAGRQPASDAERAYRAGLLLSVGQVDETESVLSRLSTSDSSARPQRLATALRQLIAAVKRQPNPETNSLQLTSELLAGSYFEQAQGIRETSLDSALQLARRAATNSPQFGFAWERLAELEFSYGHTRAALDALEKSLALSPRNAQALALKGFLLAANNDTREATEWFNRALAVDSAIGNAWLGRGLCRIRRGDVAGGREDLLIAAALEPQRADLRSYLAKAYAITYDNARAEKELQLAKKLDPNDPTAWLYSALLNQNNNRINQGIRDLEKSAELNDNRSVYRSQLLLDQDHAVRSANLAKLYADAGMPDVGIREASRAVSYDYANYSAHLFLANSYEAQRGFAGANLRYETPAQTEFMVANLLAPVGAGPLSATVSQQEYSPMFERDRLGLVSQTEYLSRGGWQENFAQYGTFETFNYTLEGIYITDPGQRENNDFEDKELQLTLKQQFTPQDTLLLNAAGFQRNAGDVRQLENPSSANHVVRTKEESQDPNLELGWHHEWSPGVHTLFLAGRQVDEYSMTNANGGGLAAIVDGDEVLALRFFPQAMNYQKSQELYSVELQQIFEQADHSTVVGTLYQHTDFTVQDFELAYSPDYFYVYPALTADQAVESSFDRFSVYGYHSWQIIDPLLLVGGLSYDWMSLPKNVDSPPVTRGQESKDQWSPKAGLVWAPVKNTIVRAAYTRSLTGASIDQSFRIEPTQVAGLNQTYRSLISESLVGPTSGASDDTYALSLEKKFETGTYVGIMGELLYSDVRRDVGTFFYDVNLANPYPILTDYSLQQTLHYQEQSLLVTLDQLLGQEWAVGVRYCLTQGDLDKDYHPVPDLEPDWYDFPPHQRLKSLLHEVSLHANFNHVSGLFTTLEAIWYQQINTGSAPESSDDFWQMNLLGGYHLFHRRARLELGVLNLTGQDYRLNPLTVYNELPRERTFVTRLKLAF